MAGPGQAAGDLALLWHRIYGNSKEEANKKSPDYLRGFVDSSNLTEGVLKRFLRKISRGVFSHPAVQAYRDVLEKVDARELPSEELVRYLAEYDSHQGPIRRFLRGEEPSRVKSYREILEERKAATERGLPSRV